MEKPQITVKPHKVLTNEEVVEILIPGYHPIVIYMIEQDGKPVAKVLHRADTDVFDVELPL
jgi:hypothetical protein